VLRQRPRSGIVPGFADLLLANWPVLLTAEMAASDLSIDENRFASGADAVR